MSLFPIISPAAAVFSPTDIVSLELWLDAAQGVTKDGSDFVSAWADQSGNGVDFVSASTSRPLWQASRFNSLPGIVADGSNDYMDATGESISNAAIHIFAVCQQASWTLYDYPMEIKGTSTITIQQRASTPQVAQGASNVVSMTLNTPFLWETCFLNSTANFQKLNAGSKVTGANPGHPSANITDITLFNARDRSWDCNFEYAELVWFSAELTGDDLTNMQTYLNDKYSVY